jgi:3-carboxy-cis,cis-muconate cycloisomerase
MPQKRNPVDATLALAAARLAIGAVPVVLGAMAQEHERAAGAWQAEWEAVPAIFRHTAGAVAHVRAALGSVEVDAARMRANLADTHGAIMAEALAMALAPHLGRPAAQSLVRQLVEGAASAHTDLGDAVRSDARVRAVLTPDAIDHAFDPAGYLGGTDIFIDRALAAFRAPRAEEVPHAR